LAKLVYPDVSTEEAMSISDASGSGERPIGILKEDAVRVVGLFRFNLVNLIEAAGYWNIAVAYKDVGRLCDELADEFVCEFRKIPGVDPLDAFWAYGRDTPGNRYDFIWVRAGWRGYRKAMQGKARFAKMLSPKTDAQGNPIPGPLKLPPDLHADHVINRASLKATGSDAWVMLCEVPASANSGFGSMVERFSAPVDFSARTRIDLDPLLAFKLWATDMPKTPAEFEAVMEHITGQFDMRNRHARETVQQMRIKTLEALPHLAPRPHDPSPASCRQVL
jgi:hypothetical protein